VARDHELQPVANPYDAHGRVPVAGAPEWKYRPFEPVGDGDERALTVTAERSDGLTVSFTVPAYLTRGDELHEVTCVIIRARERTERTAGLGA
jgi:hypothetical protein